MSTSNSPNPYTPHTTTRPSLALIAGPTASGKSDLAVRLAQTVPRAVVINADSAQVYADLSILSARPTADEMHGIPHRLFGAWDGARSCSAAEWASAARTEIDAAHAAGALPILVGGTGLYIRTLLDGIAPIPPIDPDIRAKIRAMHVAQAYAALRREDPARAAIIAPADTTRIARALEVVRSTGHTMTHWHAERTGGISDAVTVSAVVLMPEREWLYERCDRRFAAMWHQGAVDEVRALLARKLDWEMPVMRAIGVRQVAAFLDDEIDEATAIVEGSQATRNYAKRQYTWLRNQMPEAWPRLAIENYFNHINVASLFQV